LCVAEFAARDNARAGVRGQVLRSAEGETRKNVVHQSRKHAMPVRSENVFLRFLAISRAIAGQMSYDGVLRAVAAGVQDLIPNHHMDVVLLSRDRLEHHCYEVGVRTVWGKLAERPGPTSASPIRSVLWAERPYIRTDDALTDSRFHFEGALDGPIYSANLRSRIIMPLRVHGNVVGAINISHPEPGRYDDDHVTIAQHCADLLAPYFYALVLGEEARTAAVAEGEALARAHELRAGALRLTEWMEAERNRIALDVHDQTLADLARISRRTATLRERGGAGTDELAALETDVAVCLGELRRIIEDMKPTVLELFGFREAVEALLTRNAVIAPRPIAYEVVDATANAPDALPTAVRTTLYRVVQEAVNNALAHSGATLIAVRIDLDGGGLVVEICDDGCGFDPRAALAKGGGVAHISTRADLIGARVEIAAGEEQSGTTVRIRIPLSGPARITH
jgi:signal transduction histidine kinase